MKTRISISLLAILNLISLSLFGQPDPNGPIKFIEIKRVNWDSHVNGDSSITYNVYYTVTNSSNRTITMELFLRGGYYNSCIEKTENFVKTKSDGWDLTLPGNKSENLTFTLSNLFDSPPKLCAGIDNRGIVVKKIEYEE